MEVAQIITDVYKIMK